MKSAIQIAGEEGLVLHVLITTNKPNDKKQKEQYLLFQFIVDVFYGSSKINIMDLSSKQISAITKKYDQFIKNYSFKDFKKDSKTVLNNLLKPVGLSYLQAIKITTTNGFSNNLLGQTFIELDADIFSMFNNGLISTRSDSTLGILRLHQQNVEITNKINRYQKQEFINRISQWLVRLKKIVFLLLMGYTAVMWILTLMQLSAKEEGNYLLVLPEILASLEWGFLYLYRYSSINNFQKLKKIFTLLILVLPIIGISLTSLNESNDSNIVWLAAEIVWLAMGLIGFFIYRYGLKPIMRVIIKLAFKIVFG